MSEAQNLIAAAIAQESTARHYADAVRVCENHLPIVHQITTELRAQLRAWLESDGWLCLRIEGKTGAVVWDGRDYSALRLAAYKAEIPEGLTAEALNERLEDPPRLEKWNALQAIRQGIKERYPKPEIEE